jgi:hypothetical protein
VNRRLGLGEALEERYGAILDLGREPRPVDDPDDVLEVPVRRVGRVDHHVHLRGGEPGPGHAALGERVARKPELLELGAQLVERQAEVHDGAEQHVARGSARAVEVDHAAHSTPLSLRLT